MGADLRGHLGNRIGDLSLHAGDAFARDIVNEAAGPLGDPQRPLAGRRGRDQLDQREVLAAADLGSLPYADDSFDFAIAVATYHHLNKKQQLPALQELKRVLKPGGAAFITVWNRRQPHFWFKGKEVMVPWKIKDETLYRYYYLFTYGEIKKLAVESGLKVGKIFPENSYHSPVKAFSQNICLFVKK